MVGERVDSLGLNEGMRWMLKGDDHEGITWTWETRCHDERKGCHNHAADSTHILRTYHHVETRE